MSQQHLSLTRQQLEQAIAAQETLRGTLDDAIIDATIAVLRTPLAELSSVPPDAKQQRKLVTVLFADVVGSTALLGGLDPEESMAIMDSALRQLAAPVKAHGGRVTRYMGDGFLAVFGLPRARENDPEMAVRAGLGIAQTVQDIAHALETERRIRGFQVRVGISTGLVMAGGLTDRLRTRGVESVDTRMVGRDEELRQLHESLKTVIQSRQKRFVLVVGEAGLGKSRLLQEFEDGLERNSASITLFKGRATLETLNLPYALVRDLLADRFAILDDDSIATVRSKITDDFRETLGQATDSEPKAHFVGQLLGYDFRNSSYLQHVLDAPQQLRDRALVYLIEYFRSLAVRHPVAIFLDDIHWADESSLDTLLHLGHELSNERILFVALTRPILFERRPSWEHQTNYLQLALHPLSRDQSGLLVEEVLQKAQDIPDRLRDLLIGHAEGNPFYLEELIRPFRTLPSTRSNTRSCEM